MASPDSVSFVNVQKTYPPGETLDVAYVIENDQNPATRDWIGLFRVGWSSSRDYYTFEWAPQPQDKKGNVSFAGRRLPPEDKHFYQFCYVSSDGRVRGASPPFQFSSEASTDQLDDLELVEVSEDSIMIIQSKENVEADSGKPDLEEELVTMKDSMSKLEVEKDSLLAKYEVVEQDSALKAQKVASLEEKVAGLEEKMADLEQQLQVGDVYL